MSTEASCRKFLDALAIEIYFEYDFPTSYKKLTMSDVLAAKNAKQGRPSWCDYTTHDFRDAEQTVLYLYYSG